MAISLRNIFYPAAPATEAEKRNSRKILVIEGALAGTLYAFGTNNFFAGYMTYLGMSPAHIAQICAIPQIGCLLQLIAPMYFEKRRYRKAPIILLCFIFRFCVGFAVMAPVFFTSPAAKQEFATVMYLIAFLVAGFVTPALSQWYIQIAPEDKRGHYFAIKDITATVVIAAAAFAMGRQLDFFTSIGNAYTGYLIIYGFNMTASFIDAFLLCRIREDENTTVSHVNMHMIMEPLKNEAFRPIIIFNCLCCASAMFSSGFLSVYELTVLGLTHTYITSVGIICSAAGMFALWFWGRIGDRTYWTSAILCARLIATVCLIGWWLIPLGQVRFAAFLIMILTSLGSCGMASTSLEYDSAPVSGKTTYFGVSAACGSIVSYLSAMLGSFVQQYIQAAVDIHTSIAFLFAVSAAVSLIAFVYGVIRLPRRPIHYDPDGKPIPSVR